MAQSAQAAARLIATPLTVAATMPTKLAPQYIDLGQTLFVEPGRVSTSRPHSRGGKEEGGSLPRSRSSGALGATASLAAERPAEAAAPAAAMGTRVSLRRLSRAASAPALGSLQAGTGSVDAGDAGGKAEGAEAAAGAAALAAAAAAADGSALAPMELPPRTIFPMHRMLSHRNRILGILNGGQGRARVGQGVEGRAGDREGGPECRRALTFPVLCSSPYHQGMVLRLAVNKAARPLVLPHSALQTTCAAGSGCLRCPTCPTCRTRTMSPSPC